MKRMLFLLLAALLLLSSGTAAIAAAPEKSIVARLQYASNSPFDVDNDGRVTDGSPIDFSISESAFSWPVNETSVCTQWQVKTGGRQDTSSLCQGSRDCCSLLRLEPISPRWDDPFYVTGTAASSTKQVEAQIIYAHHISAEAVMELVTSEVVSLPAHFLASAAIMNAQAAQAAQAIGTQSSSTDATVTVLSPSNASALISGEQVILTIEANNVTTGIYSLDGSSNQSLAINQSAAGNANLSALLQGGLSWEILSNGNHTVHIHLAMATENRTLDHAFKVEDTSAPALTLINISNTTVLMRTNERANISYLLSGGSNTSVALNETNEALVVLAVQNGINDLNITASDAHGNTKTVTYRLNTTIESCTDGVQNMHDGQQEGGVDCGGSCAACVNLSLTADKGSYLPAELVYLQVKARSDAVHNITVTGPSFYTSLTYNGSTYYIISPAVAGNYTANVSLKYRSLPRESAVLSFMVNQTTAESISLTIQANATEVSLDDSVAFSAAISGNATAVNYSWDFNNDTVAESTAAIVNRSASAVGPWLVKLTIFDGKGNKTATKDLTVEPYYNISVDVKDKGTGLGIPAIIVLNGQEQASASAYQGSLKRGLYPLAANLSGYLSYASTVSITKNETITLYLSSNTTPKVTLLQPADNDTLSSNESSFVIAVEKLPVTCVLYIGATQATLQERQRAIVNASPYTFSAALANGTQYWKVRCNDGEEKSGESELRAFTILELSQRDVELRNEAVLIIEQIDGILQRIDAFPKAEREVADAMGYRKLLETAKFELQRANRDLFNMKWRRFNASEEDVFRQEIINRLALVRGNLTINISVVRNAEFVSYPKESTVKRAATEYVKAGKYAQEEIDQYVAQNVKLQNNISVTTKQTTMDITKYDGRTAEATLIERRLSSYNTSNIVAIEVIPKQLAQSAADINVFAPFKVLKDDPQLEIEPINGRYAFLIEKTVTPVEMQDVETVFLYKQVQPVAKKNGKITGFAVLGNEQLSNPKIIILQVMLLTLLASGYLFYMKQGTTPGARELKHLLKATAELKEYQYKDAMKNYEKMSQLFKSINKKERARWYPQLLTISHRIKKNTVLTKLKEAHILLEHRQWESAKQVYAQLCPIYKTLPQEHRKEVAAHCQSLHAKLQRAK